MYNELKAIFALATKDDDMMRQDVLFELQASIAGLLIKTASKEHKQDDLKKSFPAYFTLEG